GSCDPSHGAPALPVAPRRPQWIPVPRLRPSCDEHREQQLREEVVNDKDHDARRDDGPGGALADAFGAASCGEAEVARGNRDDSSKYERFGDTLNEVIGDVTQEESIGGDLFPDRSPIQRARDVDNELCDDVPA